MGCELCKVKGRVPPPPPSPIALDRKKEAVSKRNSGAGDSVKEYSWSIVKSGLIILQKTSFLFIQDLASANVAKDKREKVNPKDYTIENLKEQTCVRLPGTVDGQQLIIQNCEFANIFVFDHINTVTVDDCKNCCVILGPTKGSVFLRDCQDCNIVAACQQFRTRDCKRIVIFLSCSTQPIIEASCTMKFACYRLFYPDLEDQFRKAELSIYNNNWNSVHDFTASELQRNWHIQPEDVKVEEYIPYPKEDELGTVKLSFELSDSVVPFTYGSINRTSEESAIVVFFSDGHSQERARSYIHTMRKNHPTLKLLRSKEVSMSLDDAQRVLLTGSYSAVVERGKVIGLDYNGPDCLQACQNTAMEIATSTGSTGLVYVSSNKTNAMMQIDNFFGFCDIQMSG